MSEKMRELMARAADVLQADAAPGVRDAMAREIREALAEHGAIKGWRLVPIETTPEMREVFRYERMAGTGSDSFWRALLAAAPEPPA